MFSESFPSVELLPGSYRVLMVVTVTRARASEPSVATGDNERVSADGNAAIRSFFGVRHRCEAASVLAGTERDFALPPPFPAVRGDCLAF